MKKSNNLKVAIVMGSQSDAKTMALCTKVLKNFGIKFACNAIPKVSCEKKSATVFKSKKFA